MAKSANIFVVATRKLQQMDSAETLESLRVTPGNRLEQLKGYRRGYYSIRINDQFGAGRAGSSVPLQKRFCCEDQTAWKRGSGRSMQQTVSMARIHKLCR